MTADLPRVKYADVFGAKWRARFDELKALPVGTMFRTRGLKYMADCARKGRKNHRYTPIDELLHPQRSRRLAKVITK